MRLELSAAVWLLVHQTDYIQHTDKSVCVCDREREINPVMF